MRRRSSQALSIATSYGADQIGDVARLTNGFQAAFIATAGVALAGAIVALMTLRGRSNADTAPQDDETETTHKPEQDREPVAA